MGGPTWRRNKPGPGLGETTFANEGTLRRSRDDRSANAVGFHPPVLEGSRRPVTKVFRKDHYCLVALGHSLGALFSVSSGCRTRSWGLGESVVLGGT